MRRMKPLSLVLFCLTVVTAAGCDEGDDLVGMYQLDTAVSSIDSCSAGAPTDGYTHFRVRDGLYPPDGTRVIRIDLCRIVEPYSCDPIDGQAMVETDTGYRGTGAWSAGDEDDCSLHFDEVTLTVSGEQLTWLRRAHEADGPTIACTAINAEAMGAEMPCVGYTEIIGRRVR